MGPPAAPTRDRPEEGRSRKDDACHSRLLAWKEWGVPAERAEDLDARLLRAFGHELMRMVGRRTTAYLGSLLEDSAFRILWLLEESGSMTPRELSEELQLERSTITRQVNAALRLGYVERVDVAGRTGRLVRPTPDARRSPGVPTRRTTAWPAVRAGA